jgi:hypothetical protein
MTMIRPQVRIIQDQQVEINDNPQVSGWEAEQILRKYGYEGSEHSTIPAPSQHPQQGMTFEEMVAQEEARLAQERAKISQQRSGVKPHTFDGSNGYHSETRYGTDDDSGFGFKIQITSDMPIPKSY